MTVTAHARGYPNIAVTTVTAVTQRAVTRRRKAVSYTHLDVYKRQKERWRYLQKLDTKNSLLSLDGFTDSEGNPLDFIADEAMDVAEIVVNRCV